MWNQRWAVGNDRAGGAAADWWEKLQSVTDGTSTRRKLSNRRHVPPVPARPAVAGRAERRGHGSFQPVNVLLADGQRSVRVVVTVELDRRDLVPVGQQLPERVVQRRSGGDRRVGHRVAAMRTTGRLVGDLAFTFRALDKCHKIQGFRTACCRVMSSPTPRLPRATRAWNSSWEKVDSSPAPCTSTKRPSSVRTTLKSTAASLSSM